MLKNEQENKEMVAGLKQEVTSVVVYDLEEAEDVKELWNVAFAIMAIDLADVQYYPDEDRKLIMKGEGVAYTLAEATDLLSAKLDISKAYQRELYVEIHRREEANVNARTLLAKIRGGEEESDAN